jgi:hypothetical protein
MASIVYVSSSTTDVITEIASTSEVIISNLQGPQGATGPTGPQGTPGGIASVVAPITNAGTETAAIIGINSSSANTANYVVQRDANKEFVAGAVTIDTTLTPTSAPGKLYWDGGGTVNLGLAGGNVSVALGENLVSYVTNAEATTLAVGEVVYVFGAAGDRPSVKRASNTSEATSSKTLGIVAESIGANQIGFVTTRGIINKINTSAFTPGQTVYLGATAGTITSTKPVAPNHLVTLGVVLRANAGNGEIYVSVQNGFELNEIHDVLITSAANGNFLVYDSATSLWKNQAISATAPITYNAGTRTIAANAATTSASGVVQLSDSTSTTSSVLASTPTATKAAFDLATTANATANAAIPLTQKAAANGVATLGADGLVPTNQLPALAITNTFVVNSQAAMLALTAQPGDVAIRTDLSESYILTADPASTLANWQELLTPPDAVTSVDGRVGAVTLSDLYAAKTHASTHASGGSDAVTLAQSQITNLTTDLAAKAPLASPALTGTPTSTTAAVDTNTTQIATTAYVVGQGYLKSATASTTYAPIASPTFTGTLTTPNVIVTGSTVPANGIYLPATNTLGLATNSTVRLRIDQDGNIGIGNVPLVTAGIRLAKNITGGTSAYSIFNAGQIQSDVTSDATYYRTNAGTLATAFTLPNLFHYDASQATIGAGSTVTNQTGFVAQATLIGATNNFGFVGNIPSGTNRWNFFAGGTAANYFAGQTTVGSTSLALGSGSVAQQLGIVSAAATTVGLVVRGAAAATADLTQWQDSAATKQGWVTSAGSIQLLSGGTTRPIGWNTGAAARATINTTNNADLTFAVGANSTLLTLSAVGGVASTALVQTARAESTVLIVRGAASQSADLLQIQDSALNVVDSFDNLGNQRSQAQLIQYGAEGSLLQNIPTRVHPAETLLKQAVWWIDSAHSGSSGQAIKNLGWGGSALDATAGSSTAADSNDPKYLAWDGINYVYAPGTSSSFMTVPDAANLDITEDIDIRGYVALDDWTPAAINTLVAKSDVGTQHSYAFQVLSAGNLSLTWSTDGVWSTRITKTSTVIPTITDGVGLWIRATLDVDNGASGNDVKFFTSTDGITWTQLGSTVTTAGVTSIYSGTSVVNIAALNSANQLLVGKFYRAQILNGIDGVPVLDVDTSVIATGAATSFTALTGQTVTINRSTAGRKTTVVTHPVWLFGTDDFMEVNNRWLERTTANYLYLPGVASNFASSPDSAALDITGDIDLRVKVAMDDWTPAANQSLICKSSGASNISYRFFLRSDGLLQLNWSADGTAAGIAGIASTAVTGVADGAIKWVRVTFDVDNGASGKTATFFTSDDGTTWTQLGTAVTQAGTTSIFSGTASQEVGSRDSGTGEIARGKFFRAQVLNGIGGTVAFDANFETGITTNLPTTFTESSANAATVTINYSGTGYRSAGVIASTYVFPGNPNTFKLSSIDCLKFNLTESFSAVAIFRQWATTADRRIMSTGGSSGGGSYSLSQQSSNRAYFQVTDSVNFPSPVVNVTAGGLATLVGVKNVGADTLSAYINSDAAVTLTDTNTGSTTNLIDTFKIGSQTGGVFADMEFVSAAIFRRVLTAAEIATLNSYFQGRVA